MMNQFSVSDVSVEVGVSWSGTLAAYVLQASPAAADATAFVPARWTRSTSPPPSARCAPTTASSSAAHPRPAVPAPPSPPTPDPPAFAGSGRNAARIVAETAGYDAPGRRHDWP